MKRKNKSYDNLVKNVVKGLTGDKKEEDIKEPEKVEEKTETKLEEEKPKEEITEPERVEEKVEIKTEEENLFDYYDNDKISENTLLQSLNEMDSFPDSTISSKTNQYYLNTSISISKIN